MKGMTLRAFALPLVLIALAVLLGIVVMTGATDAADKALLGMIAMREGKSPDALITAAQWLTWVGDQSQRSVIMTLCALFLWWKKRKWAAITMALTPVFASVTSSILKEVFARPRPSLVPHLDHVTNLSFPSGHAVNGVAVFILAALLIPTAKRGLWLALGVLAAAIICTTRMMLGVHYPTDILGGVLVGSAYVLAGVAVARALETR